MRSLVLFHFLIVASAAAAPQLTIKQPVFEIGPIANGAPYLHDFVVGNGGDADLRITGVISSCPACLQVGISEKIIPPGGQALVHARLDLRLLHGPVDRFIRVECNDPENPSALLRLSVIAESAFEVSSSPIVLDLAQGVTTGAAEIMASSALRSPLSELRAATAELRRRFCAGGLAILS